MERKISFANLQEVVKSAYELNKSEKGGTIDPRVASEAKAGSFGISVVLTDGRSVDKGDADALFALGKIARIPLAVVLKTDRVPTAAVAATKAALALAPDTKRKKNFPWAAAAYAPSAQSCHRATPKENTA